MQHCNNFYFRSIKKTKNLKINHNLDNYKRRSTETKLKNKVFVLYNSMEIHRNTTKEKLFVSYNCIKYR